MAVFLEETNEADVAVITQLREVLGDFFSDKLLGDAAWSRGILGGTSDSL
jgi:transcription initiation factor TFIID subunit 6